MSRPLTTHPRHAAGGLPHHRTRIAAAAGAAAVAAAVVYGAAQQLASDPVAVREPAAAVSRPATDLPSADRALLEIRDSLAAQYGGTQTIARVPTRAEATEMRERLAALYGPRP